MRSSHECARCNLVFRSWLVATRLSIRSRVGGPLLYGSFRLSGLMMPQKEPRWTTSEWMVGLGGLTSCPQQGGKVTHVVPCNRRQAVRAAFRNHAALAYQREPGRDSSEC